jgi:hypothetical protein
MAKSRILKELANNEVSIEVALSRLMLIASDIDNIELKDWATKELNGYGVDDNCPIYRYIVSANVVFSGISGNFQLTNTPLPLISLPKEIYDNMLSPVAVRDSIAKIAHIFESKREGLHLDLTFYAGIIYERLGIQCTSVKQNFDYTHYGGILNALRTKLLNVFIELDKSLGNLDELDVDAKDVDLDSLRQVIVNIFQDNSMKLGDKNKINKSSILGGLSDGS